MPVVRLSARQPLGLHKGGTTTHMSEIDQLLAQIPMDQLAEQLGVPEGEAEQAARAALPALLGGLQANASDPAGALSLGQALQRHDGGLFGDDGADLGGIDTADGEKIVANIFGANTDQVIHQLGGVSGRGGSSLISKLLPILAPIVLAYLSKKLQQSGGLGDILGQVLGGGAGQSTSTRSGGCTFDTAISLTEPSVRPAAASAARTRAVISVSPMPQSSIIPSARSRASIGPSRSA